MAAPSPDNRDLLAAARAWTAANYPGYPLEYLTLHIRALPVPITIAELPGQAAPLREEERGGHGISPCVLDILRVLREVKRPLSRTRLLEEMARRGMDWNERTVAGYLSQLMQDGTIENPEDARPRGYRLPQGDETP